MAGLILGSGGCYLLHWSQWCFCVCNCSKQDQILHCHTNPVQTDHYAWPVYTRKRVTGWDHIYNVTWSRCAGLAKWCYKCTARQSYRPDIVFQPFEKSNSIGGSFVFISLGIFFFNAKSNKINVTFFQTFLSFLLFLLLVFLILRFVFQLCVFFFSFFPGI